jgi:hypothetical protein
MKTQINAHFTQRDFLPGITSGLAVIQEQSGKSRSTSGPVTTGTERESLNYECVWKGGDRGGLAGRKNVSNEKNLWKTVKNS